VRVDGSERRRLGAIFEESDRFRVVLTSRARRKRRSRLNLDRGSTLWAPRAIGWWIGILFAVGDVLRGGRGARIPLSRWR
jgi:hypothetical protein